MCTAITAQILPFAWALVSRNRNQKHLIHTTAHSHKLGKPSHEARDITIQSLLGIKVAHLLLAQPNECPALHSHTGELEPKGFGGNHVAERPTTVKRNHRAILNHENRCLIIGGGQHRPQPHPNSYRCVQSAERTAAQHHCTGTTTMASSLVSVDLHTPPQSGSPSIVGKRIPADDTLHTSATVTPSICFGADALVPFGARRRIQLLPAVVVVPSGVPVVVCR